VKYPKKLLRRYFSLKHANAQGGGWGVPGFKKIFISMGLKVLFESKTRFLKYTFFI